MCGSKCRPEFLVTVPTYNVQASFCHTPLLFPKRKLALFEWVFCVGSCLSSVRCSMSCALCVSLLQIYRALRPALLLRPDIFLLLPYFGPPCRLAVVSVLCSFPLASKYRGNMLLLATEIRPAPPHTFPAAQSALHSGLRRPKRGVGRSQNHQRPPSTAFPLEKLSLELLCILLEHVCFPILLLM